MAVTTDKREKSSLDVFMKARDLMDYTLKITANQNVFRPDIKKQKDELKKISKEEIQSKAQVWGVITTLVRIIDEMNDPVENSYVWLIRELRNDANTIYSNAWKANNIRVGKSEVDRDARLKLQKVAILGCVDLKMHISLAKKHCHLKARKIKYWRAKVDEVQRELIAWHKNDKERYQVLQ